MTHIDVNAAKQPQLLQLQKLLQRAYRAYECFQEASRASIYNAFNHPTLHGEYWRSQVIHQNISKAEEALSLALDGTKLIKASSLSRQASDFGVERVWDCLFYMSYCNANAATLERTIEDMRKRNGSAEGSYVAANAQSAVLKTKADAIRDSWRRAGVAEILIGEIVTQLQQLSSVQIEITVLNGEQTWARGITAVIASVEEYENLVERYVQTVARIVAGLSEDY